MERATSRLRTMLQKPGVIVAPSCYDPLSARIAQEVGFSCLALGGFALGAQSVVSEPLLSMKEFLDSAARIVATTDVPLLVDCCTGFGDPLHTMRTVREFERAGVAAIHIEDQVFPKRAHYHRDYSEHIIPAEEMAEKVRFACQARTDPDFVIVARTDAMKTHGYEEGMRRARLYAEAGADMVMLFPNTADEAERAPRDCDVPLVYVNSTGNRVSRPIYSTADLDQMGYKMLVEAISPIVAAYRAVRGTLENLKRTGLVGITAADGVKTRKQIEDTIGLEEYYRVEEQTVERASVVR